MNVFKKAINNANKKKKREQAKNLALATTLGVVVGAIGTLFVAPKADKINESLSEAKDKVIGKSSETVDKGKKKIKEAKKDLKEAKKQLKDNKKKIKEDIKEGKDIISETKEDVKDDLIKGKDKLKNID